ncbi:MAG: hypothetical protein PHN82_02235 [bacterium]|nr:hypothetical protein [bacterium]
MHGKLRIVLTIFSVAVLLSLLVWQRRRFPRPVEEALDRLRLWWLRVAKRIGHAQTVAILFLVYFTAIAVTAIIARCMRRDFLRLSGGPAWHPRRRKQDTIETMLRQF